MDVQYRGLTNQLAVGMVHFLPPLYALKLGTSAGIVGVIAAASSLSGLLCAIPAGKVIGRVRGNSRDWRPQLCQRSLPHERY